MSQLTIIASNTMFASKTNTFIGQVRTLQHVYPEEGRVLIYKSKLDNRYTSESEIVSHDDLRLPCTLVGSARQIFEHAKKFQGKTAVCVEEAQLLDHELIPLTNHFLDQGINVLACLLTQSFRGEPFPFQLPGEIDKEEPRSPFTVGDYLTYADELIWLTGRCTYGTNDAICGKPADRIQRFKPNTRIPSDYTDPLLQIGGAKNYAPRCRTHHVVPLKPTPFD